jgi:hypothetical protein
MMMAITCSFSYYLINFYVKYLPGSIYTNQIVNSISESVSHGSAILVLKLFHIKRGYLFSFILCGFSCILVIVSEY